MKNLKLTIATVIVGLCAIMALPATASAYPEPINPGSGSVPLTAPDRYQAPASVVSSTGWAPALVIAAVVLALLVVGLLVAHRMVAHRRLVGHRPALGA